MKKIIIIAPLLAFAAPSFAGVVTEAQKANDEQKHVNLVQKAQSLLNKKAELKERLKKIEEMLSQLDDGEDVDVKETDIRPAAYIFVQ